MVDPYGGRGGEVDVSSESIDRRPTVNGQSPESLGFRSLPFHHHLLATEN